MSTPEPHLVPTPVERSSTPRPRLVAHNGPPPNPHPVLMTAAGLEQLQTELETLRTRSREEMAQRLREARAYGVGSNNDEYYAACEEQMVIEARIAALEDTVRRATVVGPQLVAKGVAAIGSMLSVEDLDSGDVNQYRLVGAHQALERGAISAASPMGHALLGAAPGALLAVDLPNGRSRSVRVVAVEN